jgi:hypothetical protein
MNIFPLALSEKEGALGGAKLTSFLALEDEFAQRV